MRLKKPNFNSHLNNRFSSNFDTSSSSQLDGNQISINLNNHHLQRINDFNNPRICSNLTKNDSLHSSYPKSQNSIYLDCNKNNLTSDSGKITFFRSIAIFK